ncbi:hypothetical protein [uncultured Roseibium sp.]|uniref:hypothetical protein n=1 Tax=uncultured Roseibium sp. TaxID=1936171 RepID=UPI002616760C|nr:hypothetical protein [uncultured Roseibium sp.]
MGKRSDFPRMKNEYYRTFDPRAGAALKPLLQHYGVKSYCEPCVGLKDLVGQLKAFGLICSALYDINPRRPGIPYADARLLQAADLNGASDIITNPPWLRMILHSLIDVLAGLAPTFLLFEADWKHTKQSAPFMDYCTDVVSVGRLKFMPCTTQDAKENCAWYRFDKRRAGCSTIFHGRVA